MDLRDKEIMENKIIEMLDIRKKFIETENIEIAYAVLMQDLIAYFDIDRIYVGMKNAAENKCIPVIEYMKGEVPNFIGDRLHFQEYAKFINVSLDREEQQYINLVEDTSNYLTGEEFDERLSHLLPHLGYVSNPQGTPTECMIFYVKTDEIFSFIFMERYGEREELFSLAERRSLWDMYELLNSKIKMHTSKERSYNEMKIKNAMLDNEEMPMCMVTQRDRRVIYYNEQYKQFIPNVCVGVRYNDIFRGNSNLGNDYNSELKADTETLLSYKIKNEVTREDKVIYFIRKVIPVTLVDDTDVFLIYIKNVGDYIRQLDGVDLLTSAYSMKGFFAYYRNSIQSNHEEDYMLCSLDITKFKHINDVKGFKVGNEILKKISKVLRKFTNDKETFCRMNGDHFAILLRANSKEEVTARINLLFEKLEDMREDYFSDIGITYACGVVDVESDIEIDLLIDRANMARTDNKVSLENSISFFNENMERELKNEIDIESRISTAVKNGEFVPYLQPKFNLSTMKICGAEALVRWVTPTGMVLPDNFIPLFEKNGFITTLDFIVYRKIMQHIRSCLDNNVKVCPISLNVSRSHINNKNFANEVGALIKEYNIPYELLELEITESVFVEDIEVLKHFVDSIKNIKTKISIDDFGSAYSSLQILKDINIDILNIDKGFVDNLGNGEGFSKDELVLKNVIRLARDLHCEVICEGLETPEQVEILKGLGCEMGQGYVFARPMPINEYEEKFIYAV